MSVEKRDAYQRLPTYWASPDEQMRKTAISLNGLMDGEMNNLFVVTLDANVTQTQVVDTRIKTYTIAVISPQNALAAADMASIWHTAETGILTIHHPLSLAADRVVGVVCYG